jgi:hypothetical protein
VAAYRPYARRSYYREADGFSPFMIKYTPQKQQNQPKINRKTNLAIKYLYLLLLGSYTRYTVNWI